MLLPPLLPFLIIFSLWLDEERKKVWQACISEHYCLLPKLEGILLSSESRLLKLAASELSHRHTFLLGSPTESCSPPLNAHQMPYRTECPSDALSCRMNVKQGSKEQLQIHAVYTRSCSCWSLSTMCLFMLNEVWAFLNPQNIYPGSPFLSPTFQGHVPHHLLDKPTRHWHCICYCFSCLLASPKTKGPLVCFHVLVVPGMWSLPLWNGVGDRMHAWVKEWVFVLAQGSSSSVL